MQFESTLLSEAPPVVRKRPSMVVICGGMGPAASVALEREIIRATHAETDQQHLPVMHLNLPGLLSERSSYLVQLSDGIEPDQPNPAVAAARIVSAGLLAVAALGYNAVVAVPCNSFHAQPILQPFEEGVHAGAAAAGVDARIISLIDSAVEAVAARAQPGDSVGVLCTSGTRLTGVYTRALEAAGFVPQYVETQSQQSELQGAIEDIKGGELPRATPVVKGFVEQLRGVGCTAIILGCSELPLVCPPAADIVNPVVCQALDLARACSAERL